jgi:quercetin dioxygenase-like cupin family protein
MIPNTNPDYIEFAEADDIWVRAYTLDKAHSVAVQHVHEHDHITLVARGSVAYWEDGVEVSRHNAPALLTVLANKKHAFVSLTDDVVLCCLHNLRGTGLETPKVLDEVT